METKTIIKTCGTCGETFSAWAIDATGLGLNISIAQLHCDPCIEARDRRKLELMERDTRIDRSGWEAICPKAYQGFALSLLPEKSQAVAEKVFEWTPQARGIGLAGPSRGGKTFILTELMRRQHEQGKRVKMIGGTEFAYLCGSMEQSERRGLIESCCRVEMLFMDDLDKMKMTDRVESDFYHIIETRRRNLLPLFCTINGKGSDLAAMLSENGGTPIVNRLRHDVCEFSAI